MVGRKWIIYYVVTFLYCLKEGSSLICYSCSASIGHNAACENITEQSSSISHHQCFYHDAVCAIYKIKYGSDVIIYRSCKNADVCFGLSAKFNSQYNQLLECQTCKGVLCNSAYGFFPRHSSIQLFLLSLVVLFSSFVIQRHQYSCILS
ncbi:uncharacterized protein LOC123317144 [Coccinella septempunctata]|uniref:uncharacterized protein LOC123317144 n=1 Tax=Coccinella septempunctata TaxID=41139 RepID=UPI001D071D51|nr:uncharacterized protein LOC123317144 [Coccinella septempunctata]